jgi:hypothetical protein
VEEHVHSENSSQSTISRLNNFIIFSKGWWLLDLVLKEDSSSLKENEKALLYHPNKYA